MIFTIISLLAIFQLKHYLVDYPLQTPYMLGKFKSFPQNIKPLLLHSSFHALATLIILVCIVQRLELWWLALIDLISHFIIDLIKASPKLLGRWKVLSADEIGELAIKLNTATIWMRHPSQTTVYKEGEVMMRDIQPKLDNNRIYWDMLGLDQMAHHLVHYLIITLIVM